MTLDEMSSEKPVTPKRHNAEFDNKSETMRDVEDDPRVEGKKTKKKEAKKEKNKRENVRSRNLSGCLFEVCLVHFITNCFFPETEQNDEKETAKEIEKEKKEKKTRKKAKESGDQQKTDKSTKQGRKSKMVLFQTTVTTKIILHFVLCVFNISHNVTLVFAEKNVDVSTPEMESVVETQSPKKNTHSESDREEGNKSDGPVSPSPRRKHLDICEQRVSHSSFMLPWGLMLRLSSPQRGAKLVTKAKTKKSKKKRKRAKRQAEKRKPPRVWLHLIPTTGKTRLPRVNLMKG